MKNSDLKRFYEPDNSNNNDGFARLNESGKLDAPVASNKIDTGNTADGKLMAANGEGGVKFVEPSGGTTVVPNPELTGEEDNLEGIQVGENKYMLRYAPEEPGDDECIKYDTKVVLNPWYEGEMPTFNGSFDDICDYIIEVLENMTPETLYNICKRSSFVCVEDVFGNKFRFLYRGNRFHDLGGDLFTAYISIPLRVEDYNEGEILPVVVSYTAYFDCTTDVETGDTEIEVSSVFPNKFKFSVIESLDYAVYESWPRYLLSADLSTGFISNPVIAQVLYYLLDDDVSLEIVDDFGNCWSCEPSSKVGSAYRFKGRLVNVPLLGDKMFYQDFAFGTAIDPETHNEVFQVDGITTTEISAPKYHISVAMFKGVESEVDDVTDIYRINLHVDSSLISGFLTSLVSAGYTPSYVNNIEALCDYYSDVADTQGKLNIIAFMMIYFVGQYGYSLSAVYKQEVHHDSTTTIVTKAMTTECRMDTTASTLKVYFDDTPVDYVAYLLSADTSQLDFYPIR